MTARSRRWLSAIVFMAIAGALGAWVLFSADENPRDEELRKIMQEELRKVLGDIEVSFEIQTEDGTPIDGVAVDLTTSDFTDVLGGDDDPERFTVDSRFTIQKKGISAVNLDFVKEGFYAESWGYVLVERPSEALGKTYRTHVIITMTPQPEDAPLKRFKGIIRANAGGPLTVLAPMRGSSLVRMPGSIEVAASAELDSPRIFLEAEVGGDGALEAELFKFEVYSVKKPALVGGRLSLAGGSSEDGFIAAEIGEIPPVTERGFRKMMQAPRDGYAKSLQLVSVEGREELFFFCRIGGFYGKGYVSNPPAILENEDGPFAIAAVTLFMNTEGETDVAYHHP